MLHILSGPDAFSCRETLDEIIKGLGDDDFREANTTVIEAGKGDLAQIAAQIQTAAGAAPFLAAKRLVIVYGLLERFETKKAGAGRGNGKALPEEGKALADFMLHRLPESTALVLMDTIAPKSNVFYKEVSAGAMAKNYPVLRGDALRHWVQHRVMAAGGNMAPEAGELLASLVGGDLWTMSQEINKLVLYAGGRRIETRDINLLVSDLSQTSIFALVDAIMEKRLTASGQLLQKALSAGETPAHILGMLARQAQFIIRIREMKNRKLGDADIQQSLGLADFAWSKAQAQAARYSLAQAIAVYHKLLEADIAIKTSRYDGDMALNIMVAELCATPNSR
jgi:DNA polymerase III subunit delta